LNCRFSCLSDFGVSLHVKCLACHLDAGVDLSTDFTNAK